MLHICTLTPLLYSHTQTRHRFHSLSDDSTDIITWTSSQNTVRRSHPRFAYAERAVCVFYFTHFARSTQFTFTHTHPIRHTQITDRAGGERETALSAELSRAIVSFRSLWCVRVSRARLHLSRFAKRVRWCRMLITFWVLIPNRKRAKSDASRSPVPEGATRRTCVSASSARLRRMREARAPFFLRCVLHTNVWLCCVVCECAILQQSTRQQWIFSWPDWLADRALTKNRMRFYWWCVRSAARVPPPPIIDMMWFRYKNMYVCVCIFECCVCAVLCAWMCDWVCVCVCKNKSSEHCGQVLDIGIYISRYIQFICNISSYIWFVSFACFY